MVEITAFAFAPCPPWLVLVMQLEGRAFRREIPSRGVRALTDRHVDHYHSRRVGGAELHPEPPSSGTVQEVTIVHSAMPVQPLAMYG